MKVYHYDPVTKYYVGQGVADKSPLEEDVWLVPANATMNAVPSLKPEQRAVWTGIDWKVEQAPTPVQTSEEKQQLVNAKSRAYLAKTDWYIIRQQETGEPVPEDVLAKRAEARATVVE